MCASSAASYSVSRSSAPRKLKSSSARWWRKNISPSSRWSASTSLKLLTGEAASVEAAAEALVRGALQLLAVVGARDGDERARALAQVLAVEVGDAVLGDDVVDVRARGDDARALLEVGDDARLAARGRRGERDDGLAALGERRAADEVHLAADARELPRADGVGADLTRQVNLDGRVDGRHLRVAADDRRVVDVGDVEHRHLRVIVHEVIKPARAEDEARDELAGVDALLRAVDDAPFDEAHHAVGEHLGVDAEVAVRVERAQHSVGDGADAHLERRAVLDEPRDVAADGALLVRQL